MRNIDFQGLMNVVKVNEGEPDPDMRYWFTNLHSHSPSCLLSRFLTQNPSDRLKIYRQIDSEGSNGIFFALDGKIAKIQMKTIGKRFGISKNEAQFLFGGKEISYKKNRVIRKGKHWSEDKDNKTALARLRKFIYFHMKKREFCLDDKTGITIEAKACGDVNFAEMAVA